VFVAVSSAALGAASGTIEGLVLAARHSYFFHSLASYLTYLVVPALWYALAGLVLGAVVASAAAALNSGRPAAPPALAGLVVFLLVSYWGSTLDGRFFGSVGNALGHIAMLAASFVLFVAARRLVRGWVALQTNGRRMAVAGIVVVAVAAAAAAGAVAAGPLGVPVRSGGTPRVPGNDARSVLLITIDTLRADHLGCYGYPMEKDPLGEGRGTSPVLDGLAADGVRFENAIVPMIATDPSHASIMTSLYPAEHGVLRNAMQLDRRCPTLAAAFRSAGYRTGAAVSVWHLDGFVSGLSRGFDDYFDRGFHDRFARHSAWRRLPRRARDSMLGNTRDGAETCEFAAGWLRRDDGRPFFLWVHLFDPHRTYISHEGEAPPFDKPDVERLARLDGDDLARLAARGVRQYDSEIKHADSAVGSLLAVLESRGVLEEAVVVVVGDHGEHMYEGRLDRAQWFGHSDIFEEACRVPLILSGPGVAPSVVGSQVSVMDIGPTLLWIAGVGPAFPEAGGRSMAPLLAGAPWPERALVIDANPHSGTDVEGRALRAGGWKLATRPGAPDELYDLATDPDELMNLAQSEVARVHEMSEELERLSRGWMRKESPEPDDETRERLKALGYVNQQ